MENTDHKQKIIWWLVMTSLLSFSHLTQH